MRYSVVFLYDRANESFMQFVQAVHDLFQQIPGGFEILVLANGRGRSLKKALNGSDLQALKLRAFEIGLQTNHAACLTSLLSECCGERIVVFGAYQQIDLSSLRKALDAFDDRTDLISITRQNRHEPFIYRIQTILFNALVSRTTGMKAHDLNCNTKIFRREVLETTELYGNMCQFLAFYAARKGFRCKEVPCEHFYAVSEPRHAWAGLYPLSVYVNKTIDIFTLYFKTSFIKKPLRFFSYIGVTMLLAGLAINAYSLGSKLFVEHFAISWPLLIFATFLMVIGIQSASFGLLGEVITFVLGRQKQTYVIDEKLF